MPLKGKAWPPGNETTGAATAEVPETKERLVQIWRSEERLNPAAVRPQELSWCETQPHGDLSVYTSLNFHWCYKPMGPADEGTGVGHSREKLLCYLRACWSLWSWWIQCWSQWSRSMQPVRKALRLITAYAPAETTHLWTSHSSLENGSGPGRSSANMPFIGLYICWLEQEQCLIPLVLQISRWLKFATRLNKAARGMDALIQKHLYWHSAVARLRLGKILPQADLEGLQKPEQGDESQSAPVRFCWATEHHVSCMMKYTTWLIKA